MDKLIENKGSISNEEITTILETYGSLTGEINEEGAILTTPEGYIIAVSDIWRGTTNGSGSESSGGATGLPTTTGTTPYLPSTDFAQVEGTDLSSGLVITDNVGNEYVWIEVPNDGTGPDYTLVKSSIDYTNIESALKTYTETYRKNTSYDDVYYSDATTGLTETQYNNLKQTM